ncbi:MAG: phosphoribosylglycinamide formyltransferase [Clostridiales bacterium]|jgi:phosphoribosylglycinamide formyltransferase-1|nr:phosphoribosylglycinamide formyltransferase [Clostridiales bacterium]
MKKNIAVFASGGGTDFQSVIDGVRSGRVNAEIKLLITNKDGVYAIERAKNNGIPYRVLKKNDFSDADDFWAKTADILDENKIDLVVLAGYSAILGAGFVAGYYGRIINIHPSLIPKHCGPGYYGIKVHESVIASGDSVTGATVHFVDEGTDTGAVIMRKEVPVFKDDTPESLQKRVLEAEHAILPETVALFCDGRIKLIDGKAEIV